MTREHRTVRQVELRIGADAGLAPGQFIARVMRYNTLDDYRTLFRPGCFDASLTRGLPKICWDHNWAEPLGRYTQIVRNDAEVLDLLGVFDDFDAVPQARRAHAQLLSGTIDQFSVGFTRLDDEATGTWDGNTYPEPRAITRATLDEASLVLFGAVPGTELVGVRTRPDEGRERIVLHGVRGRVLSIEDAAAILTRMSLGELDLADALGQVKRKAQDATNLTDADPDTDTGDDPDPDTAPDPDADTTGEAGEAGESDPTPPVEPPADTTGDDAALEAEMDAALATIDRLGI